MEQQNPASFSALEHSALKHSMCLLLKQKNAVRNSSSQRLHTFIIFHLCHSLSNIFVQYSSILFIYSLHSHSSHGFTASTCLYRLRNLCSLPSTKALWELRTAGSQNSVTCVNPMQYGHFPESENIRNRINPVEKLGVSWDLLLVWLMPRGLCYHVRWLVSKPGTAFNTIQYFSEVNQNPKPANRSLSWAWAN